MLILYDWSQEFLRILGRHWKIWEVGKIDETWQDLGSFGKIWEDMGRFGKIWEDLGRLGKIWKDLGRHGKFCEVGKI